MILNFDPGVLLLPGECEKKIQRRLRSRAYSLTWTRKNAERHRENVRRWRTEHPDRAKAREVRGQAKRRVSKNAELRAARKADPEGVRARARATYQRRIEKARAYHRKWRSEHRDEAAAYLRRRRKEDVSFRLMWVMRSRLSAALKGKGTKASKTVALVGCTAAELKAYIESLFLPGMTWENYGKDGFEIDHIKPVAAHDLSDPEQQKACFHYTNLQPLWKADNRRKRDKWNPPLTPA